MSKAEYIDHMGDDIRVVNAARVSFNKESDWEKQKEDLGDGMICDVQLISDPDQKLIEYLASHGHWTPFSHPMITVRETVPIFVARQRFKHMVGFTYNEVSRRYVDDTPEFYRPDVLRGRPTEGVKQGSSGEVKNSQGFLAQIDAVNDELALMYENFIKSGVAPEQARMILPQSMLTSYYVTGSLYAWARAYMQRSDPHAQKEIRDLAAQWSGIIEPLFPISWEALTKADSNG